MTESSYCAVPYLNLFAAFGKYGTRHKLVQSSRPCRLYLPRSTLLQAGAVTLHLLPPPSAETATGRAAPAPSGPPPAPQPHLHAPLCFLPLLVVPAAAAREVGQLHAYAVAREMGWVEEGQVDEGERQQQQQQPTGTRVGAEGPEGSEHTAVVGNLLLGGTGSASDAVAAMAALHGNSMYSLSYDFGALLDLPYRAACCTAGGGGGASAPAPWVFSGVLRLLAERGMGACLRMGLGAMQRAGVRLDLGGIGPEGARRDDVDHGTTEGGAPEPSGAGVDVDAAVRFLLEVASGRTQGSPRSASSRSSEQGVAVAGGHLGRERQASSHSGRASKPGAHATEMAPGASVRGSGNSVASFGAPPTPQDPLDSVGTPHSQSSSSGTSTPSSHGPPRQLPQLPSTWRWCLGALVFGFSPAHLEAEYQRSYKAARCRAYDFTALAVHVAMAFITLVRMIQDGHAAGGGQGGDELAGAAAGGAGGRDSDAAAAVREAHGGGYDPQLAAQVLWVGVNLLAFLLVALTPLHAR